MDPIGFALENFDHAGKWRSLDGRTPIDATGQMVDGTRLDGSDSLRRALVARADVFAEVAAEKMLTYAVGRGDAAAGHAVGARDRARRRGRPLPVLVARARRRPNAAVPDAHEGRRRPNRRGRSWTARETRRRRSDVHHQEASVTPHLAARHRRVGGAAAARLDGGGADAGTDGGAEDALRGVLRAARRHDGQVDAGGRRGRLRVHGDPQAARAVPRSHDGRERAGAPLRRRRRRRGRLGRRQPHARGRRVPHRVGAAARSAGASRRVGRSGGGAAHRPGHAAAVAGAVDRGVGARLRGQLQLRLSQLDLVEVAHPAAADAEQSAAGVREAVRRRGNAGRAPRPPAGHAQPARFGDGAAAVAAARPAAGRSPAARSVSRGRARDRAAHSARRSGGARGRHAAGRADRRAGRRSPST